jgi:hypothetical protein
MNKKLHWTLVAIFVVGFALAVSSAGAQTTTCTGTLAAGIYTNVNVPRGVTCFLASPITITGNVIVAAGATLLPLPGTVHPPGVQINGSVVATDAVSVTLAPVTVGGNVVLRGITSQVEIAATNIGGNVQIQESSVDASVVMDSNAVVGNVLLINNRVPSNVYVIARNTIGGNLVCVGNTPAPSNVFVVPPPTAFPNTVGGNKVGQCVGL